MRPVLLRLLAALLVLSLGIGRGGPLAAPVQLPGERHVVVLHTNDIHGQVLPRPAIWLKDVNPVPDSGGLPRLAGTLRRLVREAEAEGASVFVVDAGDWFQGTPEGQVERGRAFLRALAAAGHDAMTVGNHEFDHGVDAFLEHLEEVPVPALLANARTPEGAPLPGTRDHLVVERGGLRVGFVGLLTATTPTITHRQTKALLWEEPAAALTRVRRALAGTVDLVVPVTHMGVEEDVALARAHPDLPLVVGGHSHSFLRTGVREGEVLIVQAGAKASVIGRVDLWLDGDGRVLRSEARHVDLYEDPAPADCNLGVDALCAELAERAAARMDEVVGVLAGPLEVSRRPLVNASAGSLIADLIRERARADVAIHNRGGVRTTLPAGPVTRRDLFMLLPFDNHVETVTLSGAELTALFARSVEGDRRPLEFSGATLVVREEQGKAALVRVEVGGRPVAAGERYRLATNSFLSAGGDGWGELADFPEREADLMLLRDLMEQAFAGGVLAPPVDQRYEIVR